jgi:choline dehydrogenase-like flavoprotein
MSRIDLQELPSGQQFESDVCIVGSDIAGLVLAVALRGSDWGVDLLEAGSAGEEAECQALYAAEMAVVPHLGTTEGRCRVYGGSSPAFGAASCCPWLPMIFSGARRRQRAAGPSISPISGPISTAAKSCWAPITPPLIRP